MTELTARDIQENLKGLKDSFFSWVIFRFDKKISILEFVEKHYLPTLVRIHDSKYFAKKEKQKIKDFEIQTSSQRDVAQKSIQLHDEESDDAQRDTLILKDKVSRQLEDLNELFQIYPAEKREDSVHNDSLEKLEKEVIVPKEEKETLDREFNEYEKLCELQGGIDNGVVDQKFPYWDPTATERWQHMCIRSEYDIHKISLRLINRRIEDILNIIEKKHR